MKKKIAMLMLGLMVSVAGHAQFEQNKVYFSAATSGLDFNFNSTDKWKLDVQAKFGYMFVPDWMIFVNADYGYRKYSPDPRRVGAGIRYYIEQNGLFMGMSGNYVKTADLHEEFMPELHMGYAFFLSRTVTIEPEVYYQISTKDYNDRSTVGFRLGFGIYLGK